MKFRLNKSSQSSRFHTLGMTVMFLYPEEWRDTWERERCSLCRPLLENYTNFHVTAAMLSLPNIYCEQVLIILLEHCNNFFALIPKSEPSLCYQVYLFPHQLYYISLGLKYFQVLSSTCMMMLEVNLALKVFHMQALVHVCKPKPS